MASEIPLGGGRVTGAVRVGDTVRRAIGPWTPTVHAYLRHLEERGFRGAPRVLGIDRDGREMLTFLEGAVPSDSAWKLGTATPMPPDALTDAALATTASLIRELHDAARDFVPAEPVWREYDRPITAGEIVCHGDLGPHNTVYRDGLPVGFIDWDGARPNLAELEAAQAAWWFVPLADEEYLRAFGFLEPPDVGRRLRVFFDAYGVRDAERIFWLLQQAIERSTERFRYWPDLDASGAARILRHAASDLDWLETNAETLRSALD